MVQDVFFRIGPRLFIRFRHINHARDINMTGRWIIALRRWCGGECFAINLGLLGKSFNPR